MKKRWINLMIIVVFALTLVSCTSLRGILSGGSTNNITNNVTNNITENTVKYDELSVGDLQDAITTVVDKVERAVVGVTLKQVTVINSITNTTSEDDYSYGSAVVFKQNKLTNTDGGISNYEYYAITNAHVVTGTEKTGVTYKTYVYLGYDDIEVETEVVGKDVKADVACIRFKTYVDIQPVVIADSDKVEKGSFAIAIGNPEGFDYYGSSTLGIVSGTERYLKSDTDGDNVNDFVGVYIQHDASINPGNSGGGLFNLNGELIGINTIKIVVSNVDNMGFAIPSNVAYKLCTEYFMKDVEIVRPRLGVVGIEVRALTNKVIASNNLQEIPNIYEEEKPYGIYVRSIVEKGSLSSSGIKADDILLTFDGIKLTSNDMIGALLQELTKYTVGMSVEITYYSRQTSSIKTATITLASL